MLKNYIVTPPAADKGDALTPCFLCGGEWPASELNNAGVCPNCVFEQSVEEEDDGCEVEYEDDIPGSDEEDSK